MAKKRTPTSSPSRPSAKSSDRVVRVGLTQMACVEDVAANRKANYRLVERALDDRAQIVCTQELFTSLYFCQCEDHRFFKLAETIPGPSTELFGKLAKKAKATLVLSLFERRAQGLYHNTAVILGPDGKIAGIYRKMHIPDDPLYYEKFYFTPGDTGFRAWDVPQNKTKLGVLVCWDQWYPEGARLTALQGAEMLFYPTAIGWHPSEKAEYGKAQHESWEIMMRSHAIANGCYVIAPNRIGVEKIAGPDGKVVSEDGIEFWGQSFICAPNGQLIAKASSDKEEVLVADLDLDKVDFSRTHWPFLRDRRIDAYGQITQRFIGDAVPMSGLR
jgi:N-carbamoylputrescine amidase